MSWEIDEELAPLSAARSWPAAVRVRWKRGTLGVDEVNVLQFLMRAMDLAMQDGFIAVAPGPQSIDVGNVLTERRSMLALLACYFRLPNALAAELATDAGDDDPDSVQ